MKLAKYEWINTADGLGSWFEAAMIATFPGAFPGCYDNHDVEAVLRKAGVIPKYQRTDTESCALVIMFASPTEGCAFIDRLNRYLENAGDGV